MGCKYPSTLVKGQFTVTAANTLTYTLPNTEAWEVSAVFLEYTSGAAAGNRVPAVVAKDASGNVLWQATADAVQAASLTDSYSFQAELGFTQATGGYHSVGLPSKAYIPIGGSLTITDLAGISAGGDSIPVLTVTYERIN